MTAHTVASKAGAVSVYIWKQARVQKYPPALAVAGDQTVINWSP